jgi:hypothetical protein
MHFGPEGLGFDRIAGLPATMKNGNCSGRHGAG